MFTEGADLGSITSRLNTYWSLRLQRPSEDRHLLWGSGHSWKRPRRVGRGRDCRHSRGSQSDKVRTVEPEGASSNSEVILPPGLGLGEAKCCGNDWIAKCGDGRNTPGGDSEWRYAGFVARFRSGSVLHAYFMRCLQCVEDAGHRDIMNRRRDCG